MKHPAAILTVRYASGREELTRYSNKMEAQKAEREYQKLDTVVDTHVRELS